MKLIVIVCGFVIGCLLVSIYKLVKENHTLRSEMTQSTKKIQEINKELEEGIEQVREIVRNQTEVEKSLSINTQTIYREKSKRFNKKTTKK